MSRFKISLITSPRVYRPGDFFRSQLKNKPTAEELVWQLLPPHLSAAAPGEEEEEGEDKSVEEEKKTQFN